MRVLMVGSGEAFHLEPLTRCLKLADPSCRVESHGLFRVQPDGRWIYLDESPVFDAVHQLEEQPREIVKAGRIARSSARPPRRKHLPLYLAGVRMIQQSVLWWRDARRFRKQFDQLLDGIDVIHLQGLGETHALRWVLGGVPKPIVASCWGSDIFRIQQPILTLAQRRIFERASAITVTGSESVGIILARYGRHLAPKIHNTYFNPDIGDYATGDREAASASVRERWNIPPDRLIVCIGHNGNPDGQHSGVIESLANLDRTARQRLFVLLPMTYGGDLAYRKQIERALGELAVDGMILEDYLSDAEMKAMRLATDVFVFAPVSDGFSSSVSQALAAGSVVILGSWLPYAMRRSAGFEYVEVDRASDAGRALGEVLRAWPEPQQTAISNRALSSEFFDPMHIGNTWHEVYESAVGRFRETGNAK
jgi:hypothetical protein